MAPDYQNYYYQDIDDDNDGILDIDEPDHLEVTSKPKDPEFLGCKLSIYSKTYNRGDSFTLDIDNSESNTTLKINDLSTGN